MRTRSKSLTRAAALLGASGVAAALALIPVASANAAIQSHYNAQADASARYTGSVSGGSCALTAGKDEVDPSSKTLTGPGTKHSSVAISATFTNNQDSSDQVQVKGNYTSTLIVKNHKQDLASMTLTGSGKLAVKNSLAFGSDCSGSGLVAGFTETEFTEHSAGELVLTRSTANNALSLIGIINVKTDKLVAVDEYEGNASKAVSKAALKPGTYEIEEAANGITVGAGGILKHGSAPRSAKLKTSLNVTFTAKK